MSAARALARKYNDGLAARGDHSREWYVNDAGELRLRTKLTGYQRRLDMEESR